MSQIYATQTTDATPTAATVVTAPDNAGHWITRVGWSAFTSAANNCSGVAILTWAKDAMSAPVYIGALSSVTKNTGYGAAPTVTGDVSGQDMRIILTGVAATTIDWKLQLDGGSQVL